METLPTEILLQVFRYLSVNDLVRCRIVNSRWRCIIDNMFDRDLFWKHRCAVDFPDIYEVEKKKCHQDVKWVNLYRSLKLWGRLSEAEEQSLEFCPSNCYTEDIKSVTILPDNEMAVLKRSGVYYYDLHTFSRTQRKPIAGNFIKYSENDTVVVLLSMQLQLMVLRKSNSFLLSNERTGHVPVTTFSDIKDYIVSDNVIYMIEMNDSLHLCYYKTEEFKSVCIGPLAEAVIAMGIKNNELQLLLYDQKIYTIHKSHKLHFHTQLDSKCNLLQKLTEYNLIDTMNWQIYFQWMCEFKHYLEPDSIMQDLVLMRVYGDVVFIGTNWGTFRIYYRPYHNGFLDLYRSKHVIELSLIDHIMTYTLCPILSIDWQEEIEGHKVIVAVPKRIIIMKFKHTI